MSMVHFYYVGHFDPCDFVDTNTCPHRPKVQRPLSREAADRVLSTFDGKIAPFVWYDDSGFVGCIWSNAPYSLWDTIHRFALSLAEAEGATLMNDAPCWLIEYPLDARRRQAEFCGYKPYSGLG